jgi:NAD(P)-dependent dehydrogenase (short-subunit alcohol dehydrogenase family)
VNRIDLEGRRAVVTGGGRGIGRAVAERLLASGAAVSLWDRDQPTLDATRAELAGQGQVHAARVDVTDPRAVEAARDATTWSITPASPDPITCCGTTRSRPGAR